jgi:hypothetical protein
MKKIILFLFVLSSTVCHAQLSAGLKLNWNVNRFNINYFGTNQEFNDPGLGPEEIISFGGAAMVKYTLNHHFSIQSELIFNPFKTNFIKIEYYTNWQGETDYTYNSFKINMNYLEIPAIAKVSFGNIVTVDLFAGAYIGYLLSAKQSSYNGLLRLPNQFIPVDYPTHNVRKEYTSFNAGILGGMGITLRDRVIFELRLNRGLININKNGSAKIHTLQGQFSVGWYMFRHKKKV